MTFLKKCRFCHGADGKGDGPAADYINPKPRNFHSGVFKIRSTSTGALPTDEDLFHTIQKGLPGTAMPAFGKRKNGLTDKKIWQLVFFLQTLSYLWEDDEEFSESSDPYDREEHRYNRVEAIGDPPGFTRELVLRGAQVYRRAKCHECHGNKGRGDGDTAYQLKDDWNESIFPRNLHQGWRYKGGSAVKDIFKTITTGMNGTPMPSYKKALDEDERWALSYYVTSLLATDIKEEQMLKVKYTESALPDTPEDTLWEKASYIDTRLLGQIITMPRWPKASIDTVRIKAVYNNHHIAFLLTWDDIREDIQTRDKPVENDGIALQFYPGTTPSSSRRAHFLNGSPGKKVRLWFWRADKESNISGNIREGVTAGPKTPFTPLSNENQKAKSAATYKDGQWKVVMKSPVKRRIFSNALQGKPLSFAVNAWDGSNGERGMKKSLSSWKWLLLLPPQSNQIYLYPFLIFFITFVLSVLLFLKLRPLTLKSAE